MSARTPRPSIFAGSLDRRAFGCGLAAACLTGGARAEATRPIVTWGDSLTFGSCASAESTRYPAVLGRLFKPPRPVRNAGVGGESSIQIAARMLNDRQSHDSVTVIWAGRNNYGNIPRVVADVTAMVGAITHGRVLVLSILNADTEEERRGQYGHQVILDLNDALRAAHRERYVDIRTRLIDTGLRQAGISPSSQDETDIARDVPPRALRDDHIHLNDAGQAVVAKIVHASLLARGW